MSKLLLRVMALSLALAGPVWVVSPSAGLPAHEGFTSTARAEGSLNVDIGVGARVRGDLSDEPDETDTFSVHLVAGCAVNVKLWAAFDAHVELLDPGETPIDLSQASGRRVLNRDVPITRTGRYLVRVSATGDGQGRYRLNVVPKWAPRVASIDPDAATVSVALPAGGRFLVRVKPRIDGARVPRIEAVRGPDDALLGGPYGVGARSVRSPVLTAALDGYHVIAVDNASAVGPYEVIVVRRIPRVRRSRRDVRNGIRVYSYEGDGIDDLMRSWNCTGCHRWAFSYERTKQRATRSLIRMRNGTMPPNPPRVPTSEVRRFEKWIETGRKR